MKELIRRLFARRRLATEIIVSSFFVNLLSLASIVYVMQILSRYIAYGFDGTLITLTLGMLLALALAHGFSIVRMRLAAAVSVGPDRELSLRTLDLLTRIKAGAVGRIPQAKLHELLAGPQIVQAAYEAPRILAVVDMPFFLLFLLSVLILSPLLAVLTLLAVGGTLFAGWHAQRKGKQAVARFQEENTAHRGLVVSAVQGLDTVRAFLARGFLKRVFERQTDAIMGLRQRIGDERNQGQTVIGTIAGLLRVLVYAVGAKQAVAGDLSVGSLIGVSILTGKALQIATSYMQSSQLLNKADETMRQLGEFLTLPVEPLSGSALSAYSGRLEVKDLGFSFPGAPGPLFESLNFALEPGSVLAINGFNGSGKSTLVRLLVGLLEPGRGQVLIDGVDLRQIAPEWWRRQIVYLPQEPTFLNASIRENVALALPEPDNERINVAIRAADLRRYLDSTRSGLDTEVGDGGRNLPLGIRRRLALARALVVPGRLAVFDEPTEGLDAEGCAALYAVLGALVRQGVTLVVVTRDPVILKAAQLVLDLSEKPTPRLVTLKQKPAEQAGPAE
jgi:ATP-binding cassette subfamily C protein LapB